jgi:ribosomal protein L11 methyltransferase
VRASPAIDVGRPTGGTPEDDLPDAIQVFLTDFDVLAIDESAPDVWRIYFQTATERDRTAAAMTSEFPDLVLTVLDVKDEDWAARSQAALRKIHAGNIIVAPPWDAAPEKVAPITPRTTVIIRPSMGFGTGHHATTRMCLEMMQRFDLRGKNVLDVGTGSGVLAIAASLLGASFVVGIDNDPDAVNSARENLTLNTGAKVDLRIVDLRTTVLFRFDLVLANLTGALLIQTASRLQDLVAPRGPLILSGLMTEEEASVLAAFPALRVVDRAQEEEWVCVTLQREGTFE